MSLANFQRINTAIGKLIQSTNLRVIHPKHGIYATARHLDKPPDQTTLTFEYWRKPGPYTVADGKYALTLGGGWGPRVHPRECLIQGSGPEDEFENPNYELDWYDKMVPSHSLNPLIERIANVFGSNMLPDCWPPSEPLIYVTVSGRVHAGYCKHPDTGASIPIFKLNWTVTEEYASHETLRIAILVKSTKSFAEYEPTKTFRTGYVILVVGEDEAPENPPFVPPSGKIVYQGGIRWVVWPVVIRDDNPVRVTAISELTRDVYWSVEAPRGDYLLLTYHGYVG